MHYTLYPNSRGGELAPLIFGIFSIYNVYPSRTIKFGTVSTPATPGEGHVLRGQFSSVLLRQD